MRAAVAVTLAASLAPGCSDAVSPPTPTPPVRSPPVVSPPPPPAPDSAKPAPPPPPPAAPVAALQLTGPDGRRVSLTSTDSAGRRSLTCTADLAATAAGGAFALGGATVTYTPTAGGPGRVDSLSASDVAALWGAAIPAGTTRRATLRLRQPAVFTAAVALAYRGADGGADSTTRNATTTLRCEPPVLGTYVLTSINDVRLPAPGSLGTIEGDTLTFTDDLRYTTRGRWSLSSSYGLTTPPAPFDVVGADSLRLPALIAGWGGGLVTRSGTTLTMTQEQCCGRPTYTFRFDSLGSAPALPPAPAFVLSKTTVRFEAVQGGAAPAADTVFIRSNTDRAFTGVSYSGTSGCQQNICPSDWLLVGAPAWSTPTFVPMRVLKTTLPVGTYGGWVFITSPSVGTNQGVIAVSLTIRAP